MHTLPILNEKSLRHGVSLVEVMFAIMIVMVGLLGIAALIPVAGRQATDSYVLSHAAAEGQNWYRAMLARRLHVPRPNQPWLVPDDQVTGNLLSITSTAQLDAAFPRDGFCIDPLFWSRQGVDVDGVIGLWDSNQTGAYRRAFFPYFHTTYSPFTRPLPGATNPQLNWAFQPRLHRITFPSTWPTGLQPIQAKVAETLFTTLNDTINPRDEDDPSLTGIRGFYFDSSGTVAQAAADGKLSWIATLVPKEEDSAVRPSAYTLSIVVFNRRNRSFEAPGLPVPLDDPPADERIAYVDGIAFPSGGSQNMGNGNFSFAGGNGFSVALIGFRYGDRFVRPGSWVMLSRQYTSASSGHVRHLHRWFRVASASSPPDNPPVGYVDPIDQNTTLYTGDLWMQQVHLLGPDWIFQNRDLDPSPYEPTIATIVPDVVSVYERVIEIR